MRVLTLINFYPPYGLGGEELSCQAIVHGLRRRGHEVEVLTSNFGGTKVQDGIHRLLRLEMPFVPFYNAVGFFIRRHAVIRYDTAVLKRQIERFEPEVILVCSMWNIPRQIPILVESLMRAHVVYRLGNYWPALPSQHVLYWRSPARSYLTSLPKRLLARLVVPRLEDEVLPRPQLAHAICISEAVRDELVKRGILLRDVRIVYNGIDVDKIGTGESIWLAGKLPLPLRLLYVGRIEPDKGVHTAIEALARLRDDVEATLTLAGPTARDYWAKLEDLIERRGLKLRVSFLGILPPEEIPDLMRRHHVLVVPSVWPEPFGRVVLEGMATGIVVVGTGTGGMGVALKENETGLIFPPNRADVLAEQLKRLLNDPELGPRLVRQATSTVQNKFSETRMVEEVERYLLDVASISQ